MKKVPALFWIIVMVCFDVFFSPQSVNTVTSWLPSLGSSVRDVQMLRGNGAHPPHVNSANKSAPLIGMMAAEKKWDVIL